MQKPIKKPFYASKTFWINTLAILGGVATAISGDLATGGLLTAGGVVNIILRVVTKHGVSF